MGRRKDDDLPRRKRGFCTGALIAVAAIASTAMLAFGGGGVVPVGLLGPENRSGAEACRGRC